MHPVFKRKPKSCYKWSYKDTVLNTYSECEWGTSNQSATSRKTYTQNVTYCLVPHIKTKILSDGKQHQKNNSQKDQTNQ